MRSYIGSSKGQSLVEVVIACGILVITMAAIMTVTTAVRDIVYSSEEATKATALAQEGIEIARHQKDIGCTFDNILNPDGTLKTGPFVIKGDIDATDDEELQTDGGIDPSQIANFDGFARFIIVEEMAGNTSNIALADFDTGNTGCTGAKTFDCSDDYYAVRVDIHKGNGAGPIITQIRTIISKR